MIGYVGQIVGLRWSGGIRVERREFSVDGWMDAYALRGRSRPVEYVRRMSGVSLHVALDVYG